MSGTRWLRSGHGKRQVVYRSHSGTETGFTARGEHHVRRYRQDSFDVGAEHPYAANRFLEIARRCLFSANVGKLHKDAANPAVGIEPFRRKKAATLCHDCGNAETGKAIDAEDNEFARHAIWLLLLTGVRRTELLKAKWSDIDWDLRTLYVGQTKNGEPVLAPLSNAAITQLKMIARLKRIHTSSAGR